MNTGNYFLSPKKFIKACDDKYDKRALDVFYSNICWLCNGYKIKIVKDLEYHHRLHGNSNYIKNSKFNTRAFMQNNFNKLT